MKPGKITSVDHRMSGSPFHLKSYTIAVEALGKPCDFDPQLDSYPRVQMGRLRRMIDAHYAREGGRSGEGSEAQLCIPMQDYRILVRGVEV
ncbi:MAG: hypothetical protein V3V15_01800 [Sphingorhabdus sp.]